ncbi:MAG: integrase [Rhodobacteraceae bacterium]|nr:integrase [Paracoccaceae bacterium]
MGFMQSAVPRDAKMAAESFLIRHRGRTRDLYDLGLRLFFDWCSERDLHPLNDVRRPHVEAYVRHLIEDRGNAPATVGTRIAPIAGMYRYAELDDIIDRNPALYIKVPKIRKKRITPSLSMVELMLFIRTAERSAVPTDAALAHLLGGLGLRVSEAIGINVEDYQATKRGHRVLDFIGKGDKPATIPLPPRVISALDRASTGRESGPVLMRPDWGRVTAGERFTRKAAALAVTRICGMAGIDVPLTPHGLRHSFITAGLDMGLSMRDMQLAARHEDPRTTANYDRARDNLDRHAVHVISAKLAS